MQSNGICLSLSYSTQHNTLSVHSWYCRWQGFILFLWLGNIPLYLCTTSPLSTLEVHLLANQKPDSFYISFIKSSLNLPYVLIFKHLFQLIRISDREWGWHLYGPLKNPIPTLHSSCWDIKHSLFHTTWNKLSINGRYYYYSLRTTALESAGLLDSRSTLFSWVTIMTLNSLQHPSQDEN